jgi:hypothetical protein
VTFCMFDKMALAAEQFGVEPIVPADHANQARIVRDSDSARKYCLAMSEMMWGQTWNKHARAMKKSDKTRNVLVLHQETGIVSMHEGKIRIPTALLQEIECPRESNLEQGSHQEVHPCAKLLAKTKSTFTTRLETAIDVCINAPHGSYATSDEFSLILSDCVKACPPGLTGFASADLEDLDADKQDEIRSYLANVLHDLNPPFKVLQYGNQAISGIPNQGDNNGSLRNAFETIAPPAYADFGNASVELKGAGPEDLRVLGCHAHERHAGAEHVRNELNASVQSEKAHTFVQIEGGEDNSQGVGGGTRTAVFAAGAAHDGRDSTDNHQDDGDHDHTQKHISLVDAASQRTLDGIDADKQDLSVAGRKDVEDTERFSQRILDGESSPSQAGAAGRSAMADLGTGCKTRAVVAGRDVRVSRYYSRNHPPSSAATISTRPHTCVDQDLSQSTRRVVENIDVGLSQKKHTSKTGSSSKIPQDSVRSVDTQRMPLPGAETLQGHVHASLARICRALPGRWVPVSQQRMSVLCRICSISAYVCTSRCLHFSH